VNAAIITISTAAARGEREDVSGQELAGLAAAAGAQVVAHEVNADDRVQIEQALRRHADPEFDVALILTTGGTGLTPDDVTPEATRSVIEREAPGLAEAMRAESLKHTPMGMLSRGVSGIAGNALIINFPGSPKAIRQLFGVIEPVLEHAVATLRREPGAAVAHPAGGAHRDADHGTSGH
jgi:molybdenum cofactor synthesis domain-containing protein